MDLAAEMLAELASRAASPIALIRAPPLPSTIAFWLSRSTRICWWMTVEPSLRSSYFSVSTAVA